MLLTSTRPSLHNLGPAPELVGKTWLNVRQPIRLKDLRSRVVLVDMWTFGCPSCQRMIPYLQSWQDKYHSKGLVVIGNHFPEFAWEADVENLKQALLRLNIGYPVIQDNEGVNWRAYGCRHWPTQYLIDKHGYLRYRHAGEGDYAQIAAAIRKLLAEPFV